MSDTRLETPPEEPASVSAPGGPSAGMWTAEAASKGRQTALVIAIVFLGGITIVLAAMLFTSVRENGRVTSLTGDLREQVAILTAENDALREEVDQFRWEIGDFEPEVEDAQTLVVGEPLDLALAEHEAAPSSLRLDAEPGQLGLITVEVLSGRVYPYLEVFDENHLYIAEAYAYDERAGLTLWHEFDYEGPYFIQLFGEGRGDVRVTAHFYELGTIEGVLDVEDVLPVDGTPAIYEFDGVAGQLATVSMSAVRRGFLDPYVLVYGPHGDLLVEDDDGGGDLDSLARVVLPEDGRYEVEASALDEYHHEHRADQHGFTLKVEVAELLVPNEG